MELTYFNVTNITRGTPRSFSLIYLYFYKKCLCAVTNKAVEMNYIVK